MADAGVYLMRCLTPLHNGSGEGLGDLDRPIIREVTTSYPYVQGKTIKGAAKDRVKADKSTQAFTDAFGSAPTGLEEGNQGVIVSVEAQLLLFPVRSMAGTFVWATSLLCLARFATFLGLAKSSFASVGPALLREPARGSAIGPSSLTDGEAPWDSVSRLEGGTGPHLLEGLVLQSDQNRESRKAVAQLADDLAATLHDTDPFWTSFLRGRLLVLAQDDFRHLVQTATAVEANIEILSSGVTKDGSLRYSEFLPAESVLYGYYYAASLVDADRRTRAIELYERALRGDMQLGADESAGKGLVSITLF